MALTWKGGNGNWTDANWSGTYLGGLVYPSYFDSAALNGTAAYTVTMWSGSGGESSISISDQNAVLQIAGDIVLNGPLTLTSGTISAMPNASDSPVLGTTSGRISNVGGTILASGAVLDLFAVANAAQIVASAGRIDLSGSNNTNTGTITLNNGILALDSLNFNGSNTLANAGTITLAHGSWLDDSYGSIVANLGVSGTIKFLDQSGARLQIGSNGGQPFGSTIDSFQASDVIDLVNSSYDSQSRAAYSGGILSVYNRSGLVASLRMTNIGSGAAFSVAPDQYGFIKVTTTNQPTLASVLGFAAVDMTTGQPASSNVQPYTGPVSGLQDEYINVTSDNLNVAVSSNSWFVHTGSGTDGIAAHGGINVLDGGTGSNFLTGGSGTDTFFVDDRVATADIWSTVVGFHAGDAATIWGVTPQDFGLAWVDSQGATGFTGLTLHATAVGKPIASLTLAGYSQNDLNNGRLSVLFGTDPASGSTYMYVHGNS